MMFPPPNQLPCTCGHCAPPGPSPCKGSAFLMGRILSSGRQWQKNCALCLEVTGLPEHLPPPLTLCQVSAADTTDWEAADDGCGRCSSLLIAIPLKCVVRDGCGCLHKGNACITTQVALRGACCLPDGWRTRLVILPSVRLMSPSCPADCPVFDARLEVLTEVYLTRWEAVTVPPSPCEGQGDLPLYPEPCRCR